MITEIKIKRFTVLNDFQHNFKGRSVLICGSNGIGKSSVLKFCRIALGEQNCIAPGVDIEGELYRTKDGKEYKFSVKTVKGKPVVTVTGEDGMSDSRKGMIANLVGALDFNIHEFVELSKTERGRKQQVEIFKSMLPKETQEEIARLEANVATAFEERTQLNKDIKAKDIEIKTNPLNHLIDRELDKIKEVDISATMEEMKTIQIHNKKVQDIVDRMSLRMSEMDSQRIQIEKIRKDLQDMEKALQVNENKQEDASLWLGQLANKIQPTNQYEEIIKNATKTNSDYQNSQKLKIDKKILETMVSESGDYTAKIESQRQAIADAIRDMSGDFVPGLTFDENGLVYNGLSVHPDTHSTSERIKLGMLLKMAENPSLETLFIENLESVDEVGMKTIIDMANELGWQILGEEVRRGQKEMIFEIIGTS